MTDTEVQKAEEARAVLATVKDQEVVAVQPAAAEAKMAHQMEEVEADLQEAQEAVHLHEARMDATAREVAVKLHLQLAAVALPEVGQAAKKAVLLQVADEILVDPVNKK